VCASSSQYNAQLLVPVCTGKYPWLQGLKPIHHSAAMAAGRVRGRLVEPALQVGADHGFFIGSLGAQLATLAASLRIPLADEFAHLGIALTVFSPSGTVFDAATQ
jgi:hypothetical protein